MTDELIAPIPLETPKPAVSDEVALEPPRHRARTRFAVAFLISLIAGLAIGAGALYAYDRQYSGRVLPGVSVGGVDLSGLTPEAAAARLHDAYDRFGDGQALIVGGGFEMPIDYAKIDRRPDVDRMVAEAMAVGRNGNAVERVILDARTALRGVDIAPTVLFDDARLARYVQTYAGRLRIEPKNASVAVTTEGFAVTEAVEGRVADRIAPTDYLTLALADVDAPSEITVDLKVAPVEPAITTEEAIAARDTAEKIAQDISFVSGKENWTIEAKWVRAWMTFEGGDGDVYQPVIDQTRMATALASLGKSMEEKGTNATFKLSGSKITGVIPGKNGRALDVEATASRVAALLQERAAGAVNAPVEPALVVTPPNLTTEEAEAVASKMTKVSTWTTYFPISERNNFGANIWIPAMDIDGYVVGPGEVFDFWNAVGPVTRARGYGDGGAIINGKTEPQGALAGGICSCSTTLFNAALRAGFDMGARRNHYYYIDRYPIGLDATVFKSGSGSVQTMSFTNDTPYPVLIRGYKIRDGSSGYVRFDIYSVPTGRKVVISNPTIKNVLHATDTVQYTSSLAPGERKRVEYPVDGKDVWRTVTVLDANGKVIHETTYYSHYSRITGLTLIGKASASPAPSPSP
jgi:vancomycin resistance protein YoaR